MDGLDEPLSDWKLTFLLKWWKLKQWLTRCPECHERGYSDVSPKWSEDKVARMLGLAQYGCPTCGKGAMRAKRAEDDLPYEDR